MLRDVYRQAAEDGLTARELAEQLGRSVGAVRCNARTYGVKLKRTDKRGGPPKAGPDERALAMAEMYQQGHTLADIGALYGVSRERVRQIMTRWFGFTAKDGGEALRVERRKAVRKVQQDLLCLERYGCTHEQLNDLRRIGREMIAEGYSRAKTPIGAFVSQRRNLMFYEGRHVWNLKLWDWWQCWEDSGLWEARCAYGERSRLGLCRISPNMPFQPGNIEIRPIEEFCSVRRPYGTVARRH